MEAYDELWDELDGLSNEDDLLLYKLYLFKDKIARLHDKGALAGYQWRILQRRAERKERLV